MLFINVFESFVVYVYRKSNHTHHVIPLRTNSNWLTLTVCTTTPTAVPSRGNRRDNIATLASVQDLLIFWCTLPFGKRCYPFRRTLVDTSTIPLERSVREGERNMVVMAQ